MKVPNSLHHTLEAENSFGLVFYSIWLSRQNFLHTLSRTTKSRFGQSLWSTSELFGPFFMLSVNEFANLENITRSGNWKMKIEPPCYNCMAKVLTCNWKHNSKSGMTFPDVKYMEFPRQFCLKQDPSPPYTLSYYWLLNLLNHFLSKLPSFFLPNVEKLEDISFQCTFIACKIKIVQITSSMLHLINCSLKIKHLLNHRIMQLCINSFYNVYLMIYSLDLLKPNT